MHALIIGGGIAGTATALALHRAGISCELHEARDRASDGTGAFLTLAVNGLSTLRTLGFDIDTVPGIATTSMELTLGDGRPLVRFPLGPELEVDGSRIVTRTVRRADLYRALREHITTLGIPVHFGHRLTGVDQRPDPSHGDLRPGSRAATEGDAHETGDTGLGTVTRTAGSTSTGREQDADHRGAVVARFENGETASGDLLIGADGLHSRVRALIDPNAPAARYLGVLNTGGYAHGLDLGPDAATGVMRMMFGRRTFFSFLPAPDGSVWWFANPPLATEPVRGELDRDTEVWRRTLLDLVADDDPLASHIIAGSDELFAPWPTHDHPDVPTWHRGRLIIIGDAAHAASPSSGQGASMAIEDAAVLALALRDRAATRGIEGAFAVYEDVRRTRVARIVAQGKRNGSGKAPGPVGRVIRDAGMRVIFASSSRRLRRGTPKPAHLPSWPYTYPLSWESDLGAL